MATKKNDFNLPADLPEEWSYGQTVAPTGAEVGLPEQYGYNYLMQVINSTMNAVNKLDEQVVTDTTLSKSGVPADAKATGTALGKKSDTSHTHDLSNLINALSTGTSTPKDDDYYVSQYAGGGTTTKTYHRRPMKALWEYIKSKANSVYLPLAGGSMTGNISYKGTKLTKAIIKFIDNKADANGNGISIGGGGATIVGGGESSTACEGLLGSGGDEKLILANDGVIDIYTNCNSGISGATHVTINTSGVYSGAAAKLSTASAGSATRPVYFANGIPVQGTYTLGNACGKTVRTLSAAGASGWKDKATDDGYVPTMAFIAYWNGAHSGTSSNLAYCKHGAFGTAVTLGKGDVIKSLSVNGKVITYTKADGTTGTITTQDTNTTYSVMKGATSSAAGSAGLVPAPGSGKQGQYLRGDGVWATPTNTTYGLATASANGLMSKEQFSKLAGIATGATGSDINALGSAYIRFNNGLQICWGSSQSKMSAEETGSVAYTGARFPVPFVDTSYFIMFNLDGISSNKNKAWCRANIPGLGCQSPTLYLAIGKWK